MPQIERSLASAARDFALRKRPLDARGFDVARAAFAAWYAGGETGVAPRLETPEQTLAWIESYAEARGLEGFAVSPDLRVGANLRRMDYARGANEARILRAFEDVYREANGMPAASPFASRETQDRAVSALLQERWTMEFVRADAFEALRRLGIERDDGLRARARAALRRHSLSIVIGADAAMNYALWRYGALSIPISALGYHVTAAIPLLPFLTFARGPGRIPLETLERGQREGFGAIEGDLRDIFGAGPRALLAFNWSAKIAYYALIAAVSTSLAQAGWDHWFPSQTMPPGYDRAQLIERAYQDWKDTIAALVGEAPADASHEAAEFRERLRGLNDGQLFRHVFENAPLP